MRDGQTAIVYFVAKAIATGVGFLATVYFARLLGAEVLGIYALALAVVSWLEMLGKLGVERAIVKRLSEGTDPEAHLGAGALIMAGLFVVMAATIVVASDPIEAYVGASVVEILLFMAAASMFFRLSMAAIQGYQYVHVYALLFPARLLCSRTVQVGLVFAGFGLWGLLVGYGVGWLVLGVVGVLFLGPVIRRPGLEHLSSIFSYAKYSWLGSVRTESFRWVDVTVLGLFVSQGLVGVYLIALSIAAFLSTFGTAISTTLFPKISAVSTAGGRSEVSNLVEDSLTYAGVFLIPGVVGTIVIGDRVLAIYGQEFAVGANVLVVLIVAFLVYDYQMQLVNAVNAINRPDLGFRLNAVFIVSNIVLNVALVAAIGWIGAAIATGIAASLSFVYGLFVVERTISVQLPFAEVGRQAAAAVTMGVVVYVARLFGEETAIAAYNEVFVGILAGFGAGVYFVTLMAISARFRGTVRRNLPMEALPVEL